MKKVKFLVFVMLMLTFAFGVWSNSFKTYKIEGAELQGLTFTPWDVEAASAYVDKQGIKPYTIMIYMNGSDLESENGAATDDLIEILDSGLISAAANIIIFTGGTYRWQNNVIPANECVLWEITDGEISEICGVGLVNMGDPGTLASFINFTIKNYPADNYGLIMWDHGGGSIAGYGHDEKFDSDNLTLLDMEYAFNRAGLDQNKLEFLGFDSCLMATVEMAVVASDYANYLIASEDLEPGDGWDYGFLSELNNKPSMDGAELGVFIVDYFMQYYSNHDDEILTMSVIDLANAGKVMNAMGELMALCSESLGTQRSNSFATLAGKRSRTKTFGMGSPRDNDCDMVDIGDMAEKLSDLYPYETSAILEELSKSVVYNRHNSDSELYGLSAYYIYGAKEAGYMSLNTYGALDINREYADYLYDFYSLLRRGRATGRSTGRLSSGSGRGTADEVISAELSIWRPVDNKHGHYRMIGVQSGMNAEINEMTEEGLAAFWPMIGGENVCLYKINSTENLTLFAVPSALNGKDCDIMIAISENYPDGKILGVRYEDGFIIQKGFDKINDGDKLSFYYKEMYFGDDGAEAEYSTDGGWQTYGEIIVKEELKLEWAELDGNNIYYGLKLTDLRQNEDYTDLRPYNKP